MIVDIITLFPKMFEGPFSDSLIARAIEKKLVEINLHDLRQFGVGERKTVDDRPYGGGVGMIMKVEPIDKCLSSLKTDKSHVVLMTPQGERFNQKIARQLSEKEHLIFISGRYEGFDERVHQNYCDQELSIGDFVMLGGEIPTMAVVETVIRLIPGVVVKPDATLNESFSDPSMIEYPQYTRPEDYKGLKVPEILLSGDHRKIEAWKKEQSIIKTKKNRPDLLG